MYTFFDSQTDTWPGPFPYSRSWGRVEDCMQAHVRDTHTVKQMAVKSLVMSVWIICVAVWKYLLIYMSLIFNFLGFLLLVRCTVFLFSTCVILFLHVLFALLFTNTGLLGTIDLLPTWKYPNGQLILVKRTMISGWLLQHVVSVTVAEGGYKNKEKHEA